MRLNKWIGTFYFRKQTSKNVIFLLRFTLLNTQNRIISLACRFGLLCLQIHSKLVCYLALNLGFSIPRLTNDCLLREYWITCEKHLSIGNWSYIINKIIEMYKVGATFILFICRITIITTLVSCLHKIYVAQYHAYYITSGNIF